MTVNKEISWSFDINPGEWDSFLADVGGHPLQSALWGQAKSEADGVRDCRWAAFCCNEPILMARFEVRSLPLGLRVAWVPRGPLLTDHPLAGLAHEQFLERLRHKGYLVCFTDPYQSTIDGDWLGKSIGAVQETLWVDLSVGAPAIFSNMHKKLRYGVRAAERAGVVLEESRSPVDVKAFFNLCSQVSSAKDFSLPGSAELLQELISLSGENNPFKAHLFVARHEGRLASGYFSIENGHRLHNIWNATDRDLARHCPGEAALWYQVEWAIEAGLEVYDQEGIDRENNPGCYQFKKRLGGKVISLPGLHAYPLGFLGKTVLSLGRLAGKI